MGYLTLEQLRRRGAADCPEFFAKLHLDEGYPGLCSYLLG
jgi:hypothetical protein